jgi:hypothetical protein
LRITLELNMPRLAISGLVGLGRATAAVDEEEEEEEECADVLLFDVIMLWL